MLSQPYSRALGIAVSKNDVHIVGVEGSVPTYWKNGTKTTIENNGGSANAIAISGDDIYIAGLVNNLATLWKNGAKTILWPDPSNSTAIAISGYDIYVAGNVYTPFGHSANFWKNGIKTGLSFVTATSGPSTASAIYLDRH